MNPPPGVPGHYVQINNEWCHPSRLVGELPAKKPQPDPLPTLDHCPKARSRSERSVAVRVTLIRCGSKLLDDDNLLSSFKGIRDSVAWSLGIEDNDFRVRWEYGQLETKGRCGCIVKIEQV